MIAACYRRDEAHDPELFADALAMVLGDYPADLVRTAVDPRTGVAAKFPMGLPQVGQVKQFLDDLLGHREKLSRYAALPKFHRVDPSPINREPNLFVPVGFHRYDEMAARAEKEPRRCRFERGHVCQNEIMRDGLWVPFDWWHEDSGPSQAAVERANRIAFERECAAAGIDSARGASPSLLKTLEGNDAAAD